MTNINCLKRLLREFKSEREPAVLKLPQEFEI